MYLRSLKVLLNTPRMVNGILLLATFIAIAMVPRLNVDTDPENMLVADAPARVFHNQTKKQFSMHDMIVVGAVSERSIFTPENLGDIAHVSESISQIEGVIVDDLMSLTSVDNIRQEGNNGIRFEYLMKQAPSTLEGSLSIQDAVKRLPMLNNTLVSEDGKAIAIYVPITSKTLSYQIAEEIRSITTNLDSDLAFHITGLPVAEDQFGVEMFLQMAISAPMAGAAIFFLLWLFFRNLPLIMAPMIVAMTTVLIIMGTLIGLGFTVHIMSSMIAIFLMPIAVVDSVHVLSEFADRYKPGDDAKSTITKVMQHLFKPMLFTSITSAVGFFSLLLTPIPPVKVFGAFVGSGILLAFLTTIFYLPVYISHLKPQTLQNLQKAVQRLESKGLMSRLLEKLGAISFGHPKIILPFFFILFAVSIAGITRIEINDNPVNWFKSSHEIRIADKVLNTHFAGTYDAWLVLDRQSDKSEDLRTAFLEKLNNLGGAVEVSSIHEAYEKSGQLDQDLLLAIDDLSFAAEPEDQDKLAALYDWLEQQLVARQAFQDPELLRWMKELQDALLATGIVGKTNSLVDVVRTVNRELRSGQEKDFVIPDSSEAVAQTLLQYQSSHRPQDLWHFVSTDYQMALMWLQLTSGDNQHTTKVVNWVNDYVANHPPPVEINFNWAGKSYLNIIWQDAMVKGMVESLVFSFITVFIMMVLLFRSFLYGILAMLPLSFTITMIYGLIGWFGKAYDMPIAILSALTLGLSIDFAIHFLQRTRELEKETGSLREAIKMMFDEPGRAITRNAIVIAVGFTPLLFSPLVPYITVGAFLASIMALSALATLVLLPSLLRLKNGKAA